MLSAALSRVSALCARRAALVSILMLILAVAGVVAVRSRLGVDTDTGNLFAASLPWKREQAAMARAFPQNEELLAIVVDSKVPEIAEATASSLAQVLSFDRRSFISVRQPDVSPWFDRNGLMFLDTDALASLLDQTIDAQPFLGQLAADPSLRGLASALSLLAQGVTAGADLKAFAAPLRAFHDALSAAAAGHPAPLSWQQLLSGPLSSLAGPYRFVLAKPVLDYGSIQPGARATAAVRAAAAKLPFVQDGTARVRITGSVALDDDEFSSVEQGMVGGLLGSLVLMVGWLFLALGTWRTIVPVLLTLLLGLVLTAAFAALAVGTLNLVSVAFAVLFVGLAVDFGIQFSARFREAELDVSELEGPGTGGAGLVAAVRLATRRAGAQILVAAAATAAGFLAFTPTAFKGVAQLGLIAGVGMLIAFACTMTALPAFLGLFRPRALGAEGGYRWARPVDDWVVRWRRPILWASAGFAAVGAALLGQVPFDSDPLHTKNQATESVRTLNDLAADPITNPYTIEILEPSTAAAAALAPRLEALTTVDSVLTLDSLVPDNQAAKLPLIRDAASLLLPSLGAPPQAVAPTPAEMRRAVESAASAIGGVAGRLTPGDPLLAVADDLRKLATAPDAQLAAASRALTEFLPPTLDRLRTALTAVPVTRADVPPALARDWVTPTGEAKIQVLPKKGRDGQQRRAAPLRGGGVGRGAGRGRLGRDHRALDGHDHRRVPRRRRLRTCRDRRHPGVGAAAAAGHPARPGAAAAVVPADGDRGGGAAADAELRQHHRAAAAARGGRFVQRVFGDELARWPLAAAVLGDGPGGAVLRADHRHGVRVAGLVGTPGHGEPGEAAAAQPRQHAADDHGVRARAARRRAAPREGGAVTSPGTSPIVAFHAGAGTDARGRTRADILGWPDNRLEAVHDYIQWLFPLPEPSGFNPDAPLLTTADRAAFAADETLRRNLAGAHDRMLRFYGLDRSPADPARLQEWQTPGNHNMLRITRILRCLVLLGLPSRATAMLDRLRDADSPAIGARTWRFWDEAARD